jgi:hypothetical protein
MMGIKPQKWFQARLRWAVLKQGRGLHRWRESEHFFLSEDRDTAFQEALRRGYEGECWLNPSPDQSHAPRLHCRFAEVRYLEEIGADPTSFTVYLGETPAGEAMGFEHEFDPAGGVPAPIF